MKYVVGGIFTNNRGDEFIITEVFYKSNRCKIKFTNTGFEKLIFKSNIPRGEVRDDTVQCEGRGVFDTYPLYEGTKAHLLWKSIFSRCYNPLCLKKRPSYRGCTVSDEWCLFSNFKRWFDLNYKEGWYIDKDIKHKGNKVYGADFCTFLPQELNSLTVLSDKIRGEYPVGVSSCNSLTNPYKAEIRYTIEGVKRKQHLGCFKTPEEAFDCYRNKKLSIIKEKAGLYFDKGIIDESLRDMVLNYDININD